MVSRKHEVISFQSNEEGSESAEKAKSRIRGHAHLSHQREAWNA